MKAPSKKSPVPPSKKYTNFTFTEKLKKLGKSVNGRRCCRCEDTGSYSWSLTQINTFPGCKEDGIAVTSVQALALLPLHPQHCHVSMRPPHPTFSKCSIIPIQLSPEREVVVFVALRDGIQKRCVVWGDVVVVREEGRRPSSFNVQRCNLGVGNQQHQSRLCNY